MKFRVIKDFWRWKARFFYRDFKHGIKNLIKWFPVIWKDRDWDDHYIWEVLKFKLTNQANTIRKNSIHTHAEYDADKMMLCVRLIDKIQSEYYSTEHMDYQEIDFEFINDEDSNLTSVELKQKSDRLDEYLSKHKAAVRRINADGKLQIFRASNNKDIKNILALNLGYYNEQRAQRLLFETMNRHIRGWWD